MRPATWGPGRGAAGIWRFVVRIAAHGDDGLDTGLGKGDEYVDHLLAPVRVVEVDAFGRPVATFEHVKPDHFAHAEVYAALATERCGCCSVIALDFEHGCLVRLDGSTPPTWSTLGSLKIAADLPQARI